MLQHSLGATQIEFQKQPIQTPHTDPELTTQKYPTTSQFECQRKTMNSKNENIKLWILQLERQKDKERQLKESHQKPHPNSEKQKDHCHKCKKNYTEPKLIQYLACPHCLTKIETETQNGCLHWFGYLSQKDKTESVPQTCIECAEVMECMLNRNYESPSAVSEIKKWY
jgi:hypothetical protein